MRKSYLLIPCGTALALAAFFLPFALSRPEVRPDLKSWQLCQHLKNAGLDYEAYPTGPLGAWCLRVPGNKTPWEDIARGVPGIIFAQPGCVRIVPVYDPEGIESGEDSGRMRVGPLFLLGHHDDLNRIKAALGL